MPTNLFARLFDSLGNGANNKEALQMNRTQVDRVGWHSVLIFVSVCVCVLVHIGKSAATTTKYICGILRMVLFFITPTQRTWNMRIREKLLMRLYSFTKFGMVL